jgi:hypothetical protein
MMTLDYRLTKSANDSGDVFFQALCLRCIWMSGIHRVRKKEIAVQNSNAFDNAWISADYEGKAHVKKHHPPTSWDDG